MATDTNKVTVAQSDFETDQIFAVEGPCDFLNRESSVQEGLPCLRYSDWAGRWSACTDA